MPPLTGRTSPTGPSPRRVIAEIEGISAGGMPDRVKCLHVLAAHALAAGPGVNPLGDEVLASWGRGGSRAPVSESVAAFDCGTNTIKLLIGALPDVAVRESRIVRLGQGVDATGRLADAALERAFAAIDEYAALVAAHPDVRGCASALPRRHATPPMPTSSPPESTSGSACGPRCCRGRRKPRSPTTARSATSVRRRRTRSSSSTSAAVRPS